MSATSVEEMDGNFGFRSKGDDDEEEGFDF
jgi:hypothetical protein